jgi:hypothetical protein
MAARAPAGVDWRQKLENQRGAVLATELKNNANKLAKWTAGALVAGADLIKLGYVSRAHARDNFHHATLGTQARARLPVTLSLPPLGTACSQRDPFLCTYIRLGTQAPMHGRSIRVPLLSIASFSCFLLLTSGFGRPAQYLKVPSCTPDGAVARGSCTICLVQEQHDSAEGSAGGKRGQCNR